MYEDERPYSFRRALEATLAVAQNMFVKPIERQRERMLNYEYRMRKVNQFISLGLLTIIIGVPYVTYKELKDMTKIHVHENYNSLDLKRK